MIIGHASDLHGNYKKLETKTLPDLWLLTGDFFDNLGRTDRTGRAIVPAMEISYQHRWWGLKGDSVMRRLGGKPVILVGGNHDFISLAGCLRRANYPYVRDVTEGAVDFGGQRFAGYREVPYLIGEWVGEVERANFRPIIDKAMDEDPTILVTHAPPDGVLDDDLEGPTGHGPGVDEQVNLLAFRPNRVTHHFFGHIHKQGGKTQEEMGITFVNSATCLQLIDVP